MQSDRLRTLAHARGRCDNRGPVESLLLVVAELLTVPLLAALALLVEAAGVLVLGVGTAVVRPRSSTRPLLVRWWRRVVWTTTGVLGLLLAGLVFIDLVLFETGVRLALDQVEQRSGIDVGFERARGSVFTGRLELSGVTARRSGAGAEFSLAVRELVLDVDMTKIYRREVPLELVRVEGVRGDFVRRGGGQAPPRPSHAFTVERIELTDVELRFEDEIGALFQSLPIRFDHFNLAPLRSEEAMLAVLCRSDARGQARGYGFAAGGGSWRAQNIPLGPAAHKLGPAGRWIRSGEVDVSLTCLESQDPTLVALEVELRLHDFQIAPPGDGGRNLPASRIAAAITRLGPDIRVRSTVRLARDRFRGSTNVGQLGLWEGATEAWNVDLGGQLGLSGEDLLVLGVGQIREKLIPRLHDTPPVDGSKPEGDAGATSREDPPEGRRGLKRDERPGPEGPRERRD